MTLQVGVVCEGSGDFVTLAEIIKQLALHRGLGHVEMHALQPRVDATSRQMTGGGWTKVVKWCRNNSGEKLRTVFAPKLFSSSPNLDILIIHLDGDVVDISESFSSLTKASCFHNITRRVNVIECWLEELLIPPDALDDQVVYAVPVLHMESWLLAAFMKSTRVKLEDRKTKLSGRRMLSYLYGGSDIDNARDAATELVANFDRLRRSSPSLDHFACKVDSALI